MLITKEIDWGNTGELTELLNGILRERRKEHADYMRKEQMIADAYTNLSHDIRTPLTSLDGYFQLLENACDETDRKRYIYIIQERIEIQLKKNVNKAELVFRNKVESPGNIDITPIFERFYKADEARNKNSTGLGLSIAKGFVLKMDGEIEAEMEDKWFCIKIRFECEN